MVRNIAIIAAASVAATFAANEVAAAAGCQIKDSPCYPWRIEAGEAETSLLEVVPNNAITGATFRVCVCPPTKGVSMVFDFKDSRRTIGAVPDATEGPACRDFRIQTARASRLLVRRGAGASGAVEGCYVTY